MNPVNVFYKLFVVLFMSALSIASISAQRVVDTEFLGNFTEALLELLIESEFDNGVALHKVRYITSNVEGGIDTASGLLGIPLVDFTKSPLLSYQHGTSNSREDVPSRQSFESNIVLAFAASGYVTVAPDYIGLGDSKGQHPYAHAASEAWATLDLLRAVKELQDPLEFSLNDQLFLTGYSQGGHATMAAHRSAQLEYPDEFTVTASAPMSGPYDISGSMVDFTLQCNRYAFLSYLGNVALSYQLVYKDFLPNGDLSEYFKPDYAAEVEKFASEEIDLFTLNERLAALTTRDVNDTVPKYMLQPAVYQSILDDPNYPANIALADNDVYDWAPEAPTRLYYCEGDDQVTHLNSLVAEAKMNENGAPDVVSINIQSDLDHGECARPAIEATIDFFNQFKDGTSSTDDRNTNDSNYLVTPNPFDQQLSIEVRSPRNPVELTLMDIHGRTILSQTIQQSTLLSTTFLSSGTYLLSLKSDEGTAVRKVFKN